MMVRRVAQVLARAINKGTNQPVNDYLKATNRKKVCALLYVHSSLVTQTPSSLQLHVDPKPCSKRH